MKRTATTLVLLAGFGGGCVSPDAKKDSPGGFGTVTRGLQVAGVQGPNGEPVMAARGAMPGGRMPSGTGIQQVGLFSKVSDGCTTCAHVPGMVIDAGHSKHGGFGGHGGYGGYGDGMPMTGIMPVPGMGPPGAVAGVGAMVRGGPQVANGRTSVKFTGPAGMKITWQLPNGSFNDEASGLTAPKEYNFVQGQVYRLRLTQVLPNHPGKAFYPTLEIAPGNPKTITFLAHSSVPLSFTNEDFDQAAAGNLVVKVIYLPDRENQDFATVAGAEELVSTRLEPGADPVAEAQRRGTILLVVRLGNIDLENKASPAMTAPPPGMMMMPPGGPGGMGAMPIPMGPGSPTSPVITSPVPPGRSTATAPPASRPAGPIAPGPMPPSNLPPVK